MEKRSISAKFIGKNVFIVKTKKSLTMYVFIFSIIFQISKTNVYVFRCKNVETGQSFLH